MNLLLSSVLVCDSSSGSSHRGGAAAQAPGQMPQSPANVAHLELPDLAVEDVLELQLQQLTLAQFTVATIEHAIPLLKTGRIYCSLFSKGWKKKINHRSLFVPPFSAIDIASIPTPALTVLYQLLFDFVKKKNLPCSCCLYLFLSPFQKVCTCSIMFWSCCAMPSSCLGTVFVSWSGTIAAWWGWSWQVKTQLMTASYVDEWIHFTEKGNWFGHQTVCHRHPDIWCSTVNENCGHVI